MDTRKTQHYLDRALEAFKANKTNEAWNALIEARELDPKNPATLRFLSVISAQSGNFPFALKFILQSIAVKPDEPLSYADLANILGGCGKVEEALRNYNRSTMLAPENPTTHYNLANLLRDIGRIDEALASYRHSASLNANDFRPFLNMGRLQKGTGDLHGAIRSQKLALCVTPFIFSNTEALAEFLRASKKLPESIIWYQRAVTLDPFNLSCLINLSDLLNEIRDPLAKNFASRAVCIDPGEARSYVNYGVSVQRADRVPKREGICTQSAHEEILGGAASIRYSKDQSFHKRSILKFHNRAVLVNPAWPDAHLNRATALLELDSKQEALIANQIAISLEPSLAKTYLNHSVICEELGSDVAFFKSIERAVLIDPECSDAQFNKSLAMLAQGQLTEGWQLYKWRWRSRITPQTYPLARQKSWSMTNPPGRLWVLPEQGIGDQILCGRFLAQAKKHIGFIIASLDPRLISLFARSFPEIDFLPETEVSEEQYDWHMALCDLPGEMLEAKLPVDWEVSQSYLTSDPIRTANIRQSLSAGDKILCGVSWQSKRKEGGAKKSASLEDLEPLLRIEGISFVNLQYGDVSDQISEFFASTGIQIKRCENVDNFSDIDGLASLIDACDFVVSTSNSTAHLAGALGKETHILLPEAGRVLLWYWKHDKDGQSLWYPSCRLYAKDPKSGWAEPLAKIETYIRKRYLSP